MATYFREFSMSYLPAFSLAAYADATTCREKLMNCKRNAEVKVIFLFRSFSCPKIIWAVFWLKQLACRWLADKRCHQHYIIEKSLFYATTCQILLTWIMFLLRDSGNSCSVESSYNTFVILFDCPQLVETIIFSFSICTNSFTRVQLLPLFKITL